MGRRQRVALDTGPSNQLKPTQPTEEKTLEAEYAGFLVDLDHIRTCSAFDSADHDAPEVIGEVEHVPGWVCLKDGASGEDYYWHLQTGKLSWEAPPDPSLAQINTDHPLKESRAAVTATTMRLRQEAGAGVAAAADSAASRRVAQAECLEQLLRSLTSKKQDLPIDNAKDVWSTVGGTIEATVAALAWQQQQHETKVNLHDEVAAPPPLPAVTRLKSLTPEVEAGSDVDMEIEEDPGYVVVHNEHQVQANLPLEETAGVSVAVPAGGTAAAAGITVSAGGTRKRKQSPTEPTAGAATTGAAATVKASKKKEPSRKAPKGAASLMNKWQAVRKELRKDDALDSDESDGEAKAAALERKRAREAEEWRTEQLRSGVSTEENANFAPLAGDWRNRFNKTKEAETGATMQQQQPSVAEEEAPIPAFLNSEHAAPAPLLAAHSMPDLDALSAGLPEGWQAMWDASSGGVYYGNLETQETQWNKPS